MIYRVYAKQLSLHSAGVVRENPQGGGVFIHPFPKRLAKMKTPPKSQKTSIFLKSERNADFMIIVTKNLVVATYNEE